MFEVRLRLMWHPQPQFAGALMAQHCGIASARGVELDCQPLDFDESPIDAVLTGNADLCIASPSHLFEAEDPEALRLLLAFQQNSPLVYLARREHGISEIKDLSGKRVAVWPGGEDLELRWMLQNEGIDPESIERVHTTDTVELLLDDQVSCAQMTSYNEYHEFIERGGDSDSMCHFFAKNNGTDLIKDGVCARKDWILDNPERAQQVVNSLLEGWTRALHDKQDAIALCRKMRPEMEETNHKIQYDEIRKLILSSATLKQGLGFPNLEHVVRAATAMSEVDYRILEESPESYVAAQFWHAAPAHLRSTHWE